MAIPFLNHLDLRSVSELQNAILHKTTSGSASDIEGKIIYDTGTDTIKYYSGSSGSGSWISLTGDTNTFRTVQVDGGAIGSSETLNLIGGTNITLDETDGAVTINGAAAMQFFLEDGDGTEVTINHNKEIKFVEGGGIDIDNPFRLAVTEKKALSEIFEHIKIALKEEDCSRSILVGHNAFFDLGFVKAATKRTSLKSPFHQFSTIDTVSLSALYCGETVLAKAISKIG